MSGSSGSGNGGGFADNETACDRLAFNTQLSSPKEDVIDDIDVDDILAVEIRQAGNTPVVVVTHKGQVAGGLASAQVDRLRDCIKAGTQYIAVVISRRDGQVGVRIKPAGMK